MNTSKVSARRMLSIASALIVTLSLAPPAVLAAGSAIKIAGDSVFVIPAGAGGMTAEKRARVVQNNLDNALVATNDRTASTVKIVYVKGTPVITVGGYSVVTVDALTARANRTTPALLAKAWADHIKVELANKASINAYLASLTGGSTTSGAAAAASSTAAAASSTAAAASSTAAAASSTAAAASSTAATSASMPTSYHRARLVFVPAGMVLPITLTTSLTSAQAQPGDKIEAKLSKDVTLENAVLPAGSIISGSIKQSKAGQRVSKSGQLVVKFDQLTTPDGSSSPLSGHLVGGIQTYQSTDGQTLHGQTTSSKVKQAAVEGAIGAGAGTLAGMTIGAIASHGYGTGKGALAGMAIGAGLGVANALLLEKGKDVVLRAGQEMQLQLDSAATVAVQPSNGSM